MKKITKISSSKFDQLSTSEMGDALGGAMARTASVTLDAITVTPHGNSVDPLTQAEKQEIDAM